MLHSEPQADIYHHLCVAPKDTPGLNIWPIDERRECGRSQGKGCQLWARPVSGIHPSQPTVLQPEPSQMALLRCKRSPWRGSWAPTLWRGSPSQSQLSLPQDLRDYLFQCCSKWAQRIEPMLLTHFNWRSFSFISFGYLTSFEHKFS